MKSNEVLLHVQNLKTYFPVYGGLMHTLQGYVHAVDDITLDVMRGETLSIVGESGCGKSTFAQTLMRICPSTSGQILYQGRDITHIGGEELRALRKEIQIIYQDPFSSLDPRMKIGETIAEPLRAFGMKDEAEIKKTVLTCMDHVGLSAAYADRYPHEFSGGQRQRVSIARALVLKPKVILCDEPVSALDVSIQSQILNLLKRLQKEMDLTYVFISHALNVVRHVSDRVCVMYLGQVVELADNDEIFHNLLHPYTKALFSAIPRPDPTLKRERMILQGDIPSPKEPPAGCRFHTRCPFAQPACAETAPELREIAPGHLVRCHRAGEV